MFRTSRTVVSDELWQRVEPFIRGRATDRGVTGRDNRGFVEAVCWIGRTGAPWRDLPPDFGAWSTVYRRFRRWAVAGVWQRILHRLTASDRERDDARPCAMLDSTAVRVHQHGAPAETAREAQAVGKSRAGWTSKLHAAVDQAGRPWCMQFTGGPRADVMEAIRLLQAVPRRAAVIADKAYDADALVDHVSVRRGKVVIPSRWNRRVPRPLDRAAYRQRNVVERVFLRLEQWRRVATRYERTVTSFAAIVFCAEIVTQAHCGPCM